MRRNAQGLPHRDSGKVAPHGHQAPSVLPGLPRPIKVVGADELGMWVTIHPNDDALACPTVCSSSTETDPQEMLAVWRYRSVRNLLGILFLIAVWPRVHQVRPGLLNIKQLHVASCNG